VVYEKDLMSFHVQKIVVLVDVLVRYLSNHSESSNAQTPKNLERDSIKRR